MATLRQELAVSKLAETSGNIGAAMKSVGYSDISSKTPAKLTKSKAWPTLMEKYLPDTLLGKKHLEFLTAQRLIRTYKKGDLVNETTETDPSAVKALDMAYKLKGRYSSESEGNKTLIINISGESASRYNVAPTVHTDPQKN